MAPRSKADSVKHKTIEHTVSFLTKLPEKPKEDLSLREAIKQLQVQLKDALKKGYSYPDLAEMLTDQGIKISALTLKNYLPSGKRQATKSTRKPRKAAGEGSGVLAESAQTTGNSEEPTTPVEKDTSETSTLEATPASTPTKARRGRTKSAATTTVESETSPQSSRTRKSSPAKSAGTGRRKRLQASK
jgi:hypothetical protein